MLAMDLTGRSFARWTVLERAANTPQGQAQWRCRCECGVERVLKSIVLRRGLSQSCGCLKLEQLHERSTKHGHSPAAGYSPTYSTWAAMVKRCTNPHDSNWSHYGGRGITVCDRWRDFRNFLADLGEKPAGCTLDRIDNQRGYEPDNCRWADKTTQVRNRRITRTLTWKGETRALAEWAKQTGTPYATLQDRLQHGWTTEDALCTTGTTRDLNRHHRILTMNGESHTLTDWSRKLGIPLPTLSQRLHRGWTPEQVLSTPHNKQSKPA